MHQPPFCGCGLIFDSTLKAPVAIVAAEVDPAGDMLSTDSTPEQTELEPETEKVERRRENYNHAWGILSLTVELINLLFDL